MPYRKRKIRGVYALSFLASIFLISCSPSPSWLSKLFEAEEGWHEVGEPFTHRETTIYAWNTSGWYALGDTKFIKLAHRNSGGTRIWRFQSGDGRLDDLRFEKISHRGITAHVEDGSVAGLIAEFVVFSVISEEPKKFLILESVGSGSGRVYYSDVDRP